MQLSDWPLRRLLRRLGRRLLWRRHRRCEGRRRALAVRLGAGQPRGRVRHVAAAGLCGGGPGCAALCAGACAGRGPGEPRATCGRLVACMPELQRRRCVRQHGGRPGALVCGAGPTLEIMQCSPAGLHVFPCWLPPPPAPQLQGIITLWPRQNWVTDLEYTHKYFGTGRMFCLPHQLVGLSCTELRERVPFERIQHLGGWLAPCWAAR